MELDIETRAMKFASEAAIGGRYDEETKYFDGACGMLTSATDIKEFLIKYFYKSYEKL